MKITGWIYIKKIYTWSGEENDKKTNDLQTRHFVARDLERDVRCIETQREAKVCDRAQECQKIAWYLLHPDDEEFKDIMKNTPRKLEIPMPVTMPCKLQRDKYRETCRVEEHKTKFACIVEADEAVGKRMERSPHKNHEDHIAGKGMNSLSHHNLVHKFIPMLQAMKIPDAKAAVEKGLEKLQKIPA